MSSIFVSDAELRRKTNEGVSALLSQSPPQRWDHPLLAEPLFGEVLRLERKRTERSNVPFLLLVADIEQLINVDQPSSSGFTCLVNDLLSAAGSCTRETDIIGWCRYPSAIGLLFTNLVPSSDMELSVECIVSRVNHHFETHLGKERYKRIAISWHVYPNDHLRALQRQPGLDSDLLRRDKRSWLNSSGKRAVDIVASGLSLVFFSPVFFMIALLVKLTSRGPVIFRQERVGQFGGHFTFLKFRSMYIGRSPHFHEQYVRQLIAGEVNPNDGGVYKLQDDPRVTRIGKLLRRTSLDELPQLWNVFKGEMSLVGPRPPLPYEVEKYKVWHRGRYFEAKPGITGLWQVTGRSRVCFDDMVRLDLRYARLCSLKLDFRILLRTPRAVISGAGAY